MNNIPETCADLVDAWIRFTRSGRESYLRDELFWAYEEFARATEENAELSLELIRAVLAKDHEMPVIGAIAAGPMEDLLVNFGPSIIDRVEEIAMADPVFRSMLGGVWKSDIDSAIWERIEAIRDKVW